MRSLLFPFWPTLIVALVVALALSGCAPKREKAILLTTAGDADWQAGLAGVDAFTSASSPADVTRVAEQLRTRILAILDATA